MIHKIVTKFKSIFFHESLIRYLIIGFTTVGLTYLSLEVYRAFLPWEMITNGVDKLADALNLHQNFQDLLTQDSLRKSLSYLGSILTSGAFNFMLSYHWTFKVSGTEKRSKLLKYITVFVFNSVFQYIFYNFVFVYNEATFNVLHFPSRVFEYLVIALNIGMIVCWNFVLYRFWVFKK